MARDIMGLPFVRQRDKTEVDLSAGILPRDFWSIGETGDYEADFRLGKMLAERYIDLLASDDFMPLLGVIVQDMIRKGRFAGVEIGFLHLVEEHAFRGACEAQPVIRRAA